MCGLAGIYSFNNDLKWDSTEISIILKKMTSLLSHRGPDSYGFYKDNNVGFGHRRLSIIDQSKNGNQPITIGSPGKTIIFNGEIYNYKVLKEQLISNGCKFRGNSDTEVILNCYLYWGLSGLKRLEGIFALSIWDKEKNLLVLMRDRLGVKPLYYGNSKFGLAFASEIKSVIAAKGIDTSYSDQSFSEYLWYGTTYEDRSFFKGINSVKPGEWILIKDKQVIKERWWQLEDWIDDSLKNISKKDAKKRVLTNLDKAVKGQLMSDVPIGLFLSGGIDSSALASSAFKSSNCSLESYCAGFDFIEQSNEYEKAEVVAKFIGMEHSSIPISGVNLEPTITRLAEAHDQPFADAANIPLYLMCKKISQKHKVILQGDGGDELFGGYNKHLLIKYRWLWTLFPETLFSLLTKISSSYGRRINRLYKSLTNSDEVFFNALLSTTETLQLRPERLLKKEKNQFLIKNTDPFLSYRNAIYRFSDYEPLQKTLLTDLVTELPSVFLNKVDRASMAASVEARVPLLDESLIKFAINLPTDLKISGLKRKYILKKALEKRIPNKILKMPKTGFGVPYGNWLKNTLFEFTSERILDDTFLDYFNFDKLKVEECLFELKHDDKNKFIIWKLLQLSLSKTWIESIN